MIKGLRPLLERLLPLNPIRIIQWLADALGALRRLGDKAGYHRVYEILDSAASLGVLASKWKGAMLTLEQTCLTDIST